MRRWLTVIAVAGLFASLSAPASAQTDSGSTPSSDPAVGAVADAVVAPTLLTARTAPVVAGDTVWLALNWRADTDLTDFRVTAQAKGSTVTYSETTGTHAGPYQSANLRAGEIDFTSIRVEVPEDGLAGVTAIPVEISASWLVGDRRFTATYSAGIPLLRHEGDNLSLLTTQLRIASGQEKWVEIEYAGLAPALNDFRVVADVGPGLNVIYPGDGTFTSLHNDATLEDGERDVARFLLNAKDATPGVSTIELHTFYVRGIGQERVRALVELTITS